MDEVAMADLKAWNADSLIETDSAILEQVRKDLSQEYARFMGRLIKERLGAQAGGGSVFDELRKSAPSASS
jgi:hypothetical protein